MAIDMDTLRRIPCADDRGLQAIRDLESGLTEKELANRFDDRFANAATEGGAYREGELLTAAGLAERQEHEQQVTESENLQADLAAFSRRMLAAIQQHGEKSGYGETDDDRLDLFEFTESRFPGHAAGEIVYKLMGWQKERDPAYLVKVATWAFLIWKFHRKLAADYGFPYESK